jgi:hypothetical protein
MELVVLYGIRMGDYLMQTVMNFDRTENLGPKYKAKPPKFKPPKSNVWLTVKYCPNGKLRPGDRVFLYSHGEKYYVRRERGLVSFEVGYGRNKRNAHWSPWFEKVILGANPVVWTHLEGVHWGRVNGVAVGWVVGCLGVRRGGEFAEFNTVEGAKRYVERTVGE